MQTMISYDMFSHHLPWSAIYTEEHMFLFEKKAFWEFYTMPWAYLCLCGVDMVSVRVLGEMLANENIPENSKDTRYCSK